MTNKVSISLDSVLIQTEYYQTLLNIFFKLYPVKGENYYFLEVMTSKHETIKTHIYKFHISDFHLPFQDLCNRINISRGQKHVRISVVESSFKFCDTRTKKYPSNNSSM